MNERIEANASVFFIIYFSQFRTLSERNKKTRVSAREREIVKIEYTYNLQNRTLINQASVCKL